MPHVRTGHRSQSSHTAASPQGCGDCAAVWICRRGCVDGKLGGGVAGAQPSMLARCRRFGGAAQNCRRGGPHPVSWLAAVAALHSPLPPVCCRPTWMITVRRETRAPAWSTSPRLAGWQAPAAGLPMAPGPCLCHRPTSRGMYSDTATLSDYRFTAYGDPYHLVGFTYRG